MKVTPIAIVVFNRPDHARNLRNHLQGQEHRPLYVIVDGARTEKAGEVEKVEECIEIFKDWPGEIHFNISPVNLGCKMRVSSGLDWVFSQVERAIILEDDLSPHPEFFRFCDEMLEMYAHDERIMSVCGTKIFPHDVGESFFFSRYNNCWGWATWARAWKHYDDKFERHTPLGFIRQIRSFLGTYRAAFYWLFRQKQVLAGKKSSWAYCWSISGFLNKGVHVIPGQNLVLNVGFDEQSTHTTHVESYVPTSYGSSLAFPLCVAGGGCLNDDADTWIEDNLYSKSFLNRLKWLLNKGTLGKLVKGSGI